MDKTLENIRKWSGKELAVGTGSPEAEMLSPEEAAAELRALLARLPDVVELTPLERETLRRSAAMPESAIRRSIGILAVSEEVARVVGTADEVARLHEDDLQWESFAVDLKSAWKLVSGTNVVRRQRTRLLAVQAYRIAQQLARTPGNENLDVHVKEVMRLRNLTRRRKRATQTQEPSGENP